MGSSPQRGPANLTSCWQDEADRRPCGAGGLGPRVDESAPEESVMAAKAVTAAAEESVMAAKAVTAAAEESVPAAKAAVPAAKTTVPAAESAVVAAEAAVGCDHARAKRCAAVRTGNRKACGRNRRGGGLRRGDAAEQHRAGQRAGTHSAGGRAAD